MIPASLGHHPLYFRNEDTPEDIAAAKERFPNCYVNIRVVTFNRHGKWLSNDFVQQVCCQTALNNEWIQNSKIEYLGQLCRKNAIEEPMCTAFSRLDETFKNTIRTLD